MFTSFEPNCFNKCSFGVKNLELYKEQNINQEVELTKKNLKRNDSYSIAFNFCLWFDTNKGCENELI